MFQLPVQTLPHKLNAHLSYSVELLCLCLYNELSFGLRERLCFLGLGSYLLPCFVYAKSAVAVLHSIALAVLLLSRPEY